ncbi:hypothetical protein ACEWY4_003613 [Coilia grayii]|uniref:Laminin subunit alpha-3-like n=1 Tax=Coilia grayii TaxID=363190 RepID=A0ABD1KRT7_9TELE
MLVGVLRAWVWVAVLGLCLGTQGQSGKTLGRRCLRKTQAGNNPWRENSRVLRERQAGNNPWRENSRVLRERQAGNNPWRENSRVLRKYCDPAGNNNNNSSAGNIIQVCGAGQYREWRGPFKGLCVSCSCNGLSHHCDPHTGKCLDCEHNTAGDRCEHCAEGYYGNAAERTCRLCPCPFSVPSNSFALGCMLVGSSEFECVCKPGYAGLRCERCSPGYYGNPLLPHGKCQPCNCTNGNPNMCHPLTGECEKNNGGTDDCQECDACVVALMKDLEAMDGELSRLREQLGHLNSTIAPLAHLKMLEEAILATRDLVSRFSDSVAAKGSKVTHLEMDMKTIDEDLVALDNKARNLHVRSEVILKNVTHTDKRGQHLLHRAEDLLKHIQDLLDDINSGNHSSGVVPEKDAARMLQEAERLVREMRRQNCMGSRTAALSELQHAQNLLDYITRNVTGPSSTNQALVDRIAASLMRDLAGLRDLQKALIHAEDVLRRARNLNKHNLPALRKLQTRAMELMEQRDFVTSDLQMVAELLGNVSDMLSMLQDSKADYERLAAQLDGAKNDVLKKLNSLSSLGEVANTVIQAEDHARNLTDLAMAFAMQLQRAINGSSVHRFMEVIVAYADIATAIQKAEAAAREAKEAADRALEDVTKQNLTSKAMRLAEEAGSLLSKAKEAEKNLNAAVQELGSQQRRVGQASDKMTALWKDLKANQLHLRNINRASTEAVLNSTKAAVSRAEDKVIAVTTRVAEINAGLKGMKIPDAGVSDLDELLNHTNDTLQTLSNTFPTLNNMLRDVENISALAPPSGNMSDSMRRIRELIEQTRQMANAIKVPMMFTGKGYVELRPPVDVSDLRAVTTFDLHLQRPTVEPPRGDLGRKRRGRRTRTRRQGPNNAEDTFVLYLGSKNASGDFVGMMLRDNILYGMSRLGGIFQQMEISNVTRSLRDPAHYDRVEFHRVYQDIEVMYTRAYSSKNPIRLPAITLQPDSTRGLFHLQPHNTVFYIGGYPQDFTPPPEMGQGMAPYRGCIESSTLNNRILGLYNFRQVVNVNQERPCVRHVIRGKTEQLYFDGTGYAVVNITKTKPQRLQIQFNVKSLQKNALLFYIRNEQSYYSLTVEGGHLVLSGRRGGQVYSSRTDKQVFPTARDDFTSIHIVFVDSLLRLIGKTPISIPYTRDVYNSFYIGGIPDSFRERDGITAPALWGFLQILPKVDTHSEWFVETLGVMRDRRTELMDVRQAAFKAGSSLTEAPSPFENMISLGFRTTQPGSILLQATKEDHGIEVSLADGHVEVKYGRQAVRSMGKYHDGKWHYLIAILHHLGLKLTVDDNDTGSDQPGSSPVVTDSNNFTLGKDAFMGCLEDLYIRRSFGGKAYLPADLSRFTVGGDVTLGVCEVERPPQALKQKPKKKHKRKENGSSPEGCKAPAILPRAFRLTGPDSQLSFHIPPEDLNHRPHFSLVLKTASSEGLILHASRKQNGAHVALYITNGKIRLAVGKSTIHYHKRINDNQWHKVDISVEKNSFHLLVDDLRVDDGKLPAGEGTSLKLRSPVYLGADLASSKNGAQRKVPRASVQGCVYNFKFYSELMGEPVTKDRVSPCYDGEEEPGVFFSGEGAYLVSQTPLLVDFDFHLTFDIRPRHAQGLLFHARGKHKRSVSVYLQNDKVVARANDGRGDYSVSIAVPHHLCASFHSVSVHKQKNTMKLELDMKSRDVRGPPAAPSSFSAPESLYFGGVPRHFQDRHVPVGQSYVGCLRHVTLNGGDILLESLYTPHGPVSLQGCPAN